jgi:opacity protein-like surface antigen
VTFGAVGARFLIPVADSKVQPYVMAGGGIAKVSQNATFTVGGTDVTGNLAQFNIVLGSDLSGSFTKPMFVLGGGVTYPLWQQLIADFQFRFGRILAEDGGINVSRAGIGIGVRF